MKKRVHAMLMIIAMIFSMIGNVLFGVVDVKAEPGNITVKFHYTRENSDYEGWNLWTWSDSNHPLQFSEKEENGVCATGTYKATTKEVGYIVRLSEADNEWAAKDVDANRFVDLKFVLGGTVHVYITQGQEEAKIDLSEAKVAEGDIIVAASVEESALDTINFELAEPAKGEQLETTYTIESTKGAKQEIDSITLNADKKTGSIKLKTPISLLAQYVAKGSNGIEADIVTPDYYTTQDFINKYTYTGEDLGATVSGSQTTFKLWAPTAHSAKVVFYKSSSDKTDDVDKTEFMKMDAQGVWSATLPENLHGSYYTYEVLTPEGKVVAADPYAKSAGVNGVKSMVIDLAQTNPEGWDADKRQTVKNITDANIYELHVRDFSIHEDSGMTNKGKYLAFTEKGTKTSKGATSGIDYLKDLGVNYVHILPSYDFGSVDENKCEDYNWGYDPVNYNVPEGSYSTDPADGTKRVNEYKQMVKALHDEEIGVIMDVVYNHVYHTDEFSYNKIMNGYFSRPNSNGSGCGNDTATEREMVKKFIVDSVKYWATEYHIDGFRFDLMGLIDVDTMKAVREALDEIDKDIIIYGEGWNMDTKTVKEVELATQDNANSLEGIAFFNDTIRDAIKGSSQEGNETSKGFVNGAVSAENITNMEMCILGRANWTNNPSQVINYASCHDNYALWDKLCQSNPDDSEEDRIKMNLLSAAIVQTSQGTPFIMQGEELLRSKKNEDGTYNGNSYNAGDAVNAIDYNAQLDHKEVYDYYKGLIEFRANHAALRATSFDQVSSKASIIKNTPENVIAYTVKKVNKEVASGITVIYNANKTEQSVKLPKGTWKVCINGEKAGVEELDKVKGTIKVAPLSCYVLVKGATSIAAAKSGASDDVVKETRTPEEIRASRETMDESVLLIILAIITSIIIIAALLIYNTIFKNRIYSDQEVEYMVKDNNDKILKEASNIDGMTMDNDYDEPKSLSDLLDMNEFVFENDME
ncbi:MAG: type I pullulanase [Lachnospiraceae bacterium]|nr:type I pullulanase [Lachnospiraceae bacterium]